MFFRPGFAHRTKAAIPNVHEDPSQAVQGGLPGEHYHLSAALYASLIALATGPKLIAEAIYSNTGEAMHSVTGDVMSQIMTTTVVPGSSDNSVPTSTPLPIPDVVSNPVPVPPAPAPNPETPTDPLWDRVVSLANMGGTVSGTDAVTSVPTQDQYSSVIVATQDFTKSGGGVHLFWNAGRLCLGNTTLASSDPDWNVPQRANLVITPKQYTGSVVFSGNFTIECFVAQRSNPRIFPTIQIGSLSGGIALYNPLLGPDFNPRFMITANGGYASTVPGEVADIAGYTPDSIIAQHFYHVIIQRIDGTIFLAIDGALAGSITHTAPIIGNTVQIQADDYGPLRITNGVARYSGLVATPTTPFIVG